MLGDKEVTSSKKWKNLSKIITLLILITSILLIQKTTISSPEPSHPANSMWIEPAVVDVNAMGLSVGERFNVTVWLNVSVDCGAWQFYMIYAKDYVDVVAYGLTGTGGAISQFFENSGTQTWGIVSYEGSHNATHDYIQIGESWKSGPWGTGCGSLAWIEFQIISQPPAGKQIISTLDIATAHHPPTSDTYALDPEMEEIPLNVYNCLYTFKSPLAPGVAKLYVDPPEIIDPTLQPSSHFNINITIENIANLKSLQFNLTYDSSIINWIGMSTIKVQNQTPRVTSIINDEYGFIWINLEYPAPITVSFPQPIIKIDFHVCSFGATTIDIHNSYLFDASGQPIEHEATGGFFCTLIRDISLINIATSQNWVYQGWPLQINITLKNKGTINETFQLTLYYNESLIDTINVTDLAPDEERTLISIWNTTGVPEGNYTIRAEAEILPHEINPEDNSIASDPVWVMTKIHDIALIDLLAPNITYHNCKVNIMVAVRNNGEFPESFNVLLLVNETLIENFTVTALPPGDARNISLIWDTEEFSPCSNYTVTTLVPPVPYEYNLTNNKLECRVTLRYMGDTNGDGKVDIGDIYAIALSFGACYPGPNWNPELDLNQDGKIDIRDIFIVARNFGEGCNT